MKAGRFNDRSSRFGNLDIDSHDSTSDMSPTEDIRADNSDQEREGRRAKKVRKLREDLEEEERQEIKREWKYREEGKEISDPTIRPGKCMHSEMASSSSRHRVGHSLVLHRLERSTASDSPG